MSLRLAGLLGLLFTDWVCNICMVVGPDFPTQTDSDLCLSPTNIVTNLITLKNITSLTE